HTQSLFEGEVVRALLLTPEIGEVDEAAVRQALLAPVEADPDARSSVEAVAFADLPPVGPPADPMLREPLGAFAAGDVEKLEFANGVRALLWPTDNEPGRATVRVRFGGGRQAFAEDEAVYAMLGQL